jgi:ribulose-5-phosphate 4-epimerase/fuculose-1-phosphate aldolase
MATPKLVPKKKEPSVRDQVSEAEWDTRVALAAGCRMTQHFGWNDSIRNHLTARVPDEPDKFLMNPVGLLWSEITASDFLKVDFNGKCYTQSELPPGPAGLVFHGAILKAHPEKHCSFHLHPTDGVVVSAMKDGLIFAFQESLTLYNQVGFHEFESQADDREEGIRIAKELGDMSCMIMGNHGLLTVGRTIPEGFYNMVRLIDACTIQVRLMSTGAEIRHIPKEVCELTYQKFQERWNKRPFGGEDWKAYYRMMEQKDPSFKN